MDTYGLFIGGEWREPASKSYFTTANPGNEEPLAQIANGNRDDAQTAVAAARDAFDLGPWPRMSPQERHEAMQDLVGKLYAAGEDLARLESLDSGATVRRTQTVEATQAALQMQYFGEMAAEVSLTETLPTNEMAGAVANYLVREPIGVCVGIVPWNFPLLAAIWKIGPAIGMGNTVVIKPASYTPLSTQRLMQCIEESAIPPGVINCVTGGGSIVGEALVADPRVDKVTFTGSTEVGSRVMGLAAQSITKCTLELGGKSANIVLDDADLDCAVDGSLFGVFFHSGQICQSGTRLFVSERRHDEFVERLVERAQSLTVGDQMDFANSVGPLVSDAQRQTVENYVNIGLDEGATLVCGGKRPEGPGFDKGYWYEPTIFTSVDNGSRLAQEEIFGPVLAVITYSDVDEAIALANTSPYGLAGGVWTSDVEAGTQVARKLRAGTVWVNDWHQLDVHYPFGGYKQSGIGRELGVLGLHEYTEVKHIHVSPGDRSMKAWFNMTVN